MEKKSIILIVHGQQFEDYILETVAEDIAREFQHPVLIEYLPSSLEEFYETDRRQYDGNKLLKFLDTVSSPDALKTIGLYRVDLFIPILTYIFGQAIYKGHTGIASLYRLRNEQYGIKGDENLLLERFRKVVIHELGHTFGLKHCHVPDCVMRSSTYVEDIDQKKPKFCHKCKDEIRGASRQTGE